MQKRGKERGRPWFTNSPLILLLIAGLAGLYWVTSREPPGITLKYSDLKQVLQDPNVSFQKVKVRQAEIRGEIVTRDPVRQRPVPLPSRLSDAEASAHGAFVAKLGEKALWLKYEG